MLLQKLNSLLKSEKVQKFLVYGFGQAINLVSPLLVIPYILGVVGESGLGRVGVGMSIAYILIVFVDYSSYIKGVKEVAVNRDEVSNLNNIVATVYLAKLILTVAITFLFVICCFLIPYLRAEKTLFFLSLFIIYGQFINPTWYLQGVEDFKTISAINIVSKILYVTGVFLFVHHVDDYIYVNLMLGLGSIVPSLVALGFIFKKLRLSAANFKIARAIALLKTDFTFCISQLLFAFRQYSPILIIDFFAGNIMAGQFKIIEQIIMLFRTYLQMMFKFSFGTVSYEISRDSKKGLRYWKRFNIFNVTLVFVLLGIVYLGSNFVFKFFKVSIEFLPLYNQLLTVALFLPIFIGVTLAQEQLLFVFNKNKAYIKITIFITFFSTLAIFLFLKMLLLTGVMLALLLTEILLFTLYCILLKSVFNSRR